MFIASEISIRHAYLEMRKERGRTYEAARIYHLESSLNESQPSFKIEQAERYKIWMFGLAAVCGFNLLFWHFHARGFSFIAEVRRGAKTRKAKFVEGLSMIDEAKLANHLSAPRQNSLTKSDRLRLDRFYQMDQNLMELAKGLKQRISRQHNTEHYSRGAIWKDRVRVYPLPSRAHDLTEVASFIMAYPEIHGIDHSTEWPSAYKSAFEGDPSAVAGLKRIFRNKRPMRLNLQTLLEQASEVAQKFHGNAKLKRKSRGRIPALRPSCEMPEFLDSLDLENDSTDKDQETENVKRDFLIMFERFQNFKKSTGCDRIPWGYQEDPELRDWASRQRGLYRAGRLPDWKLRYLKGSGVLDRPTTEIASDRCNGSISSTWRQHYEALRAYYVQSGHSKVPRSDNKLKTLANWVWMQRARRRKSQLNEEQIQLLDDLEFDWNPRKLAE